MLSATCSCSFHVSVSCRCSREDKTVPSISTATGPATRKDSATWKANSGSVGKRDSANLMQSTSC